DRVSAFPRDRAGHPWGRRRHLGLAPKGHRRRSSNRRRHSDYSRAFVKASFLLEGVAHRLCTASVTPRKEHLGSVWTPDRKCIRPLIGQGSPRAQTAALEFGDDVIAVKSGSRPKTPQTSKKSQIVYGVYACSMIFSVAEY